ncbi:MAG: DUF5995 family protein [Nitriliruptorales bacterium]|nr:DUF5995 family protein [Nitriliruptorales bacterium]
MTDDVSGPARDIDEVIGALDTIVARSQEEGDPLGYFAVLYRAVTAKVRDGILSGFFDDDERMERLDVLFANRYLTAVERYRDDLGTTRSWQLNFEVAESPTPIVLQHLLVGINAHINLDLGIAAAETVPASELPDLKRDFQRINEVLASMMARSQTALAEISPWLGLLDTFGGRTDDELVRFSIEIARSEAWWFATELARLDRSEWAPVIAARDDQVAGIGRAVRRPGWLTPVLWLIRLRESKDVRHNLEVLDTVAPPSLSEVEANVDAHTGAD